MDVTVVEGKASKDEGTGEAADEEMEIGRDDDVEVEEAGEARVVLSSDVKV